MNLSGLAFLQYAASEMTFAEKGISAAKVILTGFVVVFAVLLLLIGIIKIYSTIVEKAQNSSEKRKNKKVAEPRPLTASVEPSKSVAVASAVQEGVSEEVVAVISAAVAAMYGSSGKARIKSIKKSNGGRSAWANAGVLENTRPF